MAITFSQTKKRQRYFLIILGLVVISIIVVLLMGRERVVSPPVPGKAEILRLQEIKIDFDILKEFPELKIFEGIVPLASKIGRGNPFMPY